MCDTSKQHEFSEHDLYYSNQGGAGTCVRHAVAKGMQREITGYTKNKYSFHTSALVGFLVNAKNFGANGCWPTDYDGVTGQVIGKGGKVFDVGIHIKQVEQGAGHVFVLELAKLFKEYEPGHDLHAVFA